MLTHETVRPEELAADLRVFEANFVRDVHAWERIGKEGMR